MMDVNLINDMMMSIADFFQYISDNKEKRLYYVIPLQHEFPYAYQHSPLRDIATLCDILDLAACSKEGKISLEKGTLQLFEEIAKNTLRSYSLKSLVNNPDGNIGDIGFYLLAMEKCYQVFPESLPKEWRTIKNQMIQFLIPLQRENGSFSIFFNNQTTEFEKSSEAFYLPEALIGLIATGDHKIDLNIEKGIIYFSKDENIMRHLAKDDATFYINWQFQLLYHWICKTLHGHHLEKLIHAAKGLKIAKVPFESNTAVVEVACYMEGLVHVMAAARLLNIKIDQPRFEKEIGRSIEFLYTVQTMHPAVYGGFVHSLFSHEARLDVAGHVFNGLKLLLQVQ